MRGFNSSANMHAHKKKQHPLEWERNRKVRREGPQDDNNIFIISNIRIDDGTSFDMLFGDQGQILADLQLLDMAMEI